ncbi:MAG: PAS domain-containing protein [Taibaiella sp.]|nr:PAS domain-containing protein [Taibaiella sp.]
MDSNTETHKILSTNEFPVVGIGASAGGLEAFKKFIIAIPENSGMAYVLVQHLDPTHESILPALLQKVTPIPVLEISDEIKVLPNHIYIIPSNKMLVANDGVLQLSPRPEKSKKELNLPINLFFSSLAEVHQAHAIGVVLSGTASDGTAGLRAIKEHGGITFAQDEASAAYDGMPQSAARAGVVDFIMPPENIPVKLVEIMRKLNRSDDELENAPQEEEEIFNQILILLRIWKGTDFTYYKHPTIRRRILRRIAINKSETHEDYLRFLKTNENEQDALYMELLIPVTSFFRDAAVFENLCEFIFPAILESKSENETIRLWVAGCSTGQEAYSIAICLKEFIGNSAQKVQLFATDLSEPAIARARTGLYSKNEVAGVTQSRLLDFFKKSADGYRINKEVRDMCVFAAHNFLKDPPFRNIDFVSCRNVLIYMEQYLQKKALATFHYALNHKGKLLLGRSETTGSVPFLFSATEKGQRIFTRQDAPARYMHVATPRTEQTIPDLNTGNKIAIAQTDFQKIADSVILANHTPAGVVINDSMDIVSFRGKTDDYLVQAPGKPTHNLLKMSKVGIAFELRTVIQKAKKEKASVIRDNTTVPINGIQLPVTIEAIPLPDMAEPHYLVLFYETPHARQQKTTVTLLASQRAEDELLNYQKIEKELAQNREDMRTITEDQDAANEKLQSANEELLSGSEELQSLNEELEASKEEMQSTNEELTVLNQELNSLNEQLNTANEHQLLLQKRMEAQALMTENLLMTAPGFICTMTGPNHVYDMVNERYQQLFGSRSIKGKPVLAALPELAGQGIDVLLDNVYNTGIPYVGTEVLVTLARDEGELPEDRYFNFSYQPIYDENKVIYAILVFGYEVTDQVIARDKIFSIQQAHAKDMEQKVQLRTAELSDANELLLQKNIELESFNYISSHDLQEPLRKIRTYASLILDKEHDCLSQRGKDNFMRIQAAAVRMQTLIEDLLLYSRASVSERIFKKTDLNTIVDEVENDLSDTIAESGAIIESVDLSEANINFFQFRQAINNLLTNAIKFARPNLPPHITIKSNIAEGSELQSQNPGLPLNKLTPGRKYCHIIFSDNGIGFDPQYNNKIFEVFQRLHQKEQYSGTGIGLAIVKKIIDNHSGAITALGKLNSGTRFDMYIPAD